MKSTIFVGLGVDMPPQAPFDLKFTSHEVTAWGGLALLKRMLEGMGFKEAVQSWDLPQPGSNRDYRPEQLIEPMIVSIWCGGRALPTLTSPVWTAPWCVCSAGAKPQATRPSCACFSVLINPAPPGYKAAASVGFLTNSNGAPSPWMWTAQYLLAGAARWRAPPRATTPRTKVAQEWLGSGQNLVAVWR
jgi:hypothetical protein